MADVPAQPLQNPRSKCFARKEFHSLFRRCVHWQLQQSSQERINLGLPVQAFLQCCRNFGLRRIRFDVQEAQHNLACEPVAHACGEGKRPAFCPHHVCWQQRPCFCDQTALAQTRFAHNRKHASPPMLQVCNCLAYLRQFAIASDQRGAQTFNTSHRLGHGLRPEQPAHFHRRFFSL